MGAEKHDVFAPMLHQRRVMDRFHRIRNLVLRENRIPAVSSDNVWRHALLFASSSKIVEYTRSYAFTIVSTEKHCSTLRRHRTRSISPTRFSACPASFTPLTRNPVLPPRITS